MLTNALQRLKTWRESEWYVFQIPVCVMHELLLTDVWKHCNMARKHVFAQLLDCNVRKLWLTCSSLDGSVVRGHMDVFWNKTLKRFFVPMKYDCQRDFNLHKYMMVACLTFNTYIWCIVVEIYIQYFVKLYAACFHL